MKKAMNFKTGFTALEVLMVMVIIGILASSSLPLYSRYVSQSKRAEAINMGFHILDVAAVSLEESKGQFNGTFPGGSANFGWESVQAFEKKAWSSVGVAFGGAQRYSYTMQYWRIAYGSGQPTTTIMVTAKASGEKSDIDSDVTPDEIIFISVNNASNVTFLSDDLAE